MYPTHFNIALQPTLSMNLPMYLIKVPPKFMMKMAIVEAVTHESIVHISQSRVANFFFFFFLNYLYKYFLYIYKKK